VLFKNAEPIETLRQVDALVVDKTGSLTLGKPRLQAVVPENGFSELEGRRAGLLPSLSPQLSPIDLGVRNS
jgi:cation transport ATPase